MSSDPRAWLTEGGVKLATGDMTLVGGAILAGEELSVIKSGYVTIRDSRIVEIGDDVSNLAGDSPRIDVTGHLLVPGFVNCHTHLGDAILKERAYGRPSGTNLLWAPDGLRFSWMDEYAREERIAAMRHAIQNMIATGTVAFADFRENGADGVIELREACAGTPIGATIYARFSPPPVQTPAELAENIAGLAPERIEELEACLDVADGFSPVWANEMTDPALRDVAKRVRAAGKRLATHAIETPNYRQLSLERTGRSDVARVIDIVQPDYVVHMTDATEEELRMVADAGLPLVLCPRGQAALGNGFSPIAAALDAGLTVSLGTDNAMLNSPDILKEMDFLARVSPAIGHDPAAVQPKDLLTAATIGGARTLGLQDSLGSISVGKLASLIVFDLNSPSLAHSADFVSSIVLSATQADIRAVLIDGVTAYGTLN